MLLKSRIAQAILRQLEKVEVMVQDVRWRQRLQNYTEALKNLTEAVTLARTRKLSNLEKQGLIQSFEFTHELAWKVMKDYFLYQGNSLITGSRDAAREAFQKGLVSRGDIWMEMIKSRNQTSHTYNQSTADDISNRICQSYHQEFLDFEKKMRSLAQGE